MGRCSLGLFLMMVPGAAVAHPGHLVEAAGHNHWVAGAAIGAAIALGLWAGLKGLGKKNADAKADGGAEPEAEPEAA